MKIKLNLDTKNTSDMGSSPIAGPQSDEYAYPEFTVRLQEDDDEDTEPDADLDEAPEEGTMVIRYRRKRTTEDNVRDECSYQFCVLEIVSVEGEEDHSPAKSYNEAGDALDKLAAEKSKERY